MEKETIEHIIIMDTLKEIKEENRQASILYSKELKEISRISSESRKDIYQRVALLSESVAVISTQLSAFDRYEMRESETLKESIKCNTTKIEDISKDLKKVEIKSASISGGVSFVLAMALKTFN